MCRTEAGLFATSSVLAPVCRNKKCSMVGSSQFFLRAPVSGMLDISHIRYYEIVIHCMFLSSNKAQAEPPCLVSIITLFSALLRSHDGEDSTTYEEPTKIQDQEGTEKFHNIPNC